MMLECSRAKMLEEIYKFADSWRLVLTITNDCAYLALIAIDPFCLCLIQLGFLDPQNPYTRKPHTIISKTCCLCLMFPGDMSEGRHAQRGRQTFKTLIPSRT